MTLETMILVTILAFLLPILTIRTVQVKMERGWRGVVSMWSFLTAMTSGLLLIQYAVGAI